jgi:hypothetical protein
MGRAKQDWIEAQERGWSAPDTFVCEQCVADDFLANVVSENASENKCSYCDKASDVPIAAPLEEIMEHVASAFFQHYAEPTAAGLPRDSGEWVGEDLITDTQDALLSFGWECNDDLFEDVWNSFYNDAWFPCASGHWLGTQEHERRKYAWTAFVEKTKHRTRYFFSNHSSLREVEEDGYPPEQILSLIGQDIEKFDLLKELNPGLELFRVRIMDSDRCFETFDDMGPPPPSLASAGRMNPPGISYGYFSFQPRTAVLEVIGAPPTTLGLATFKVVRPLLAIDLTVIPDPPSIFDFEKKFERDALIFMEEFVRTISEPVAKDGKQHIDYVPSQIVSEYIGQVLEVLGGRSIDALIYNSTLDPGGINVVVFPPNNVLDTWQSILDLTHVRKKNFPDWRAFDEFTHGGVS